MNVKKTKNLLTPLFIPFLTAILFILLIVSEKIINSQIDESQTVSEVLLIICVEQILIFIFPCIVYYFIKGRKLNTPFMLSPVVPGNTLFIIASAMLLVFGNLLIKCIYYVSNSSLPSGVDYIVSNVPSLSETPAFVVIITIALIPAICEEVFFRGIVLSEYKIYGSFNAIVFSSICFAMIHFSVEAFPLYLFSGIILGVSANVTQSIIVPIAIHFISNLLSIYASDTFLKVTVQKNGAFFAIFVIIVLFLASLIFVLSRAEHIFNKRSEKQLNVYVPRSINNFSNVFFSPGFFGLILIFIVITILN